MKNQNSPNEKKNQQSVNAAKCTCDSPCRDCKSKHTCPNVCPILKKELQS